LSTLRHKARRTWYKWLNRRSQRSRLNWKRFEDLLRDFPLPAPRVYVNLWGTNSMRRTSRGAGWSKCPRPDLARAPAG
jgi:hypothetical protein